MTHPSRMTRQLGLSGAGVHMIVTSCAIHCGMSSQPRLAQPRVLLLFYSWPGLGPPVKYLAMRTGALRPHFIKYDSMMECQSGWALPADCMALCTGAFHFQVRGGRAGGQYHRRSTRFNYGASADPCCAPGGVWRCTCHGRRL